MVVTWWIVAFLHGENFLRVAQLRRVALYCYYFAYQLLPSHRFCYSCFYPACVCVTGWGETAIGEISFPLLAFIQVSANKLND